MNITVTDSERVDDLRLLNYLTSPNITIWSAICASCSVPFAFNPTTLMIKNEHGEIKPYHNESLRGNFSYIDGSYASDLPLRRMSELFNINTYIVSQTNP